MAESELQVLFLAFDKDRSGDLNRAEWTELCNTLDLPQEQADSTFELLDSQNTKSIRLEDFICGFRTVAGLQSCTAAASQAAASVDTFSDLGDSTGGSTTVTRNEVVFESANSPLPFDSAQVFTGSSDQLSIRASELFDHLSPESQSQVCELYQVLQGEYPHLVSSFEGVILDFIKDIRTKQFEHQSLETMYRREQEINKERMRHLEEELETQLERLEETARQKVKEKLENRYGVLISQKEAAIEDLQERLRQLQQLESDSKDPYCMDEEVLNTRLDNIVEENQTLKSALGDIELKLSVSKSELIALKQELNDKAQELHHEKSVMVDYIHEQKKLTHQLTLLNQVNRRLHDTNDDLRSALENAATPTNSEQKPIAVGQYDFLIARDPLLPSQDTCGQDSDLGEEDSGMSTLRDLGDADSESEFGLQLSPRSREFGTQLHGPVYTPQSEKQFRIDEDSPTQHNYSAQMRRHSASNLEPFSIHDTQIEASIPSPKLTRHGSLRRGRPVRTHSMRRSLRLRRKGAVSPSPEDVPSSPPTILDGTPERIFKVVVVGDSSVGKTSYVTQLCQNHFSHNVASTLGVDFQTKTLTVDGRVIAVQFWDTAGQERFRSISKTFFRKSDGVLLMYDCTCQRSFSNVRHWIDTINEETNGNLPVMLIGNKTDLREKGKRDRDDVVNTAAGIEMARSYGVLFMETSAQSGFNVEESASEIARLLRVKEDMEVSSFRVLLAANQKKENSFLCCKS